jgi:hypothetical protein
MTDDTVSSTLIPLAAELIGVVRDYGPDDVAAVLARVPEGRHDALAVVLAAMVDPDKTPSQLLAWTRKPVQSRDKKSPPPRKPSKRRGYAREHGSDRGYYQHRSRLDWPACEPCLNAHADASNEASKARRNSNRKVS